MLAGQYIYKKDVDWSVLNYGMNVPVAKHFALYSGIKFSLKRGESRKIKLLIEGEAYPALLVNIAFDKMKYPNHKDLLQIRYDRRSRTAKKLGSIFVSSLEYLANEKQKASSCGKQISVPAGQREYLVLYTTIVEDTFLCECVVAGEIAAARKAVRRYNELDLEALLGSQDDYSGFIEKTRLVKIRKLDRSISDRLKVAYKNRCQVCGENIGERYAAEVVHSHHIDPFSKSLNNDPDNILIVCPNHHGIIHSVNPVFNRGNKVFVYANGYTEKLALNLHL